MGNKRLIIIFSVLAGVVVLTVAACFCFIVGDVSVKPTSDFTLAAETEAKIILDSGIAKNQNIFSIDEGIAAANIEKNNPYIKVVSIERVFPNRIRIEVTPRTEVLCVSSADKHILLDRELKILKESGKATDGLTRLVGFELPQELGAGDFYVNKALSSLLGGAEKAGLINRRFSTFIVSLELADGYFVLLTNSGVTVKVAADEGAGGLFFAAYSFYCNNADDTMRSKGVIHLSDRGWVWSQS